MPSATKLLPPPTRSIKIRGLDASVSDIRFALTPDACDQMNDLVTAATAHFNEEPTYVQQKHNLPSLITRIDCTVTDDDAVISIGHTDGWWDTVNGVVQPYEVEERPAGMGVTAMFNPQFRGMWEVMQGLWPEFGVVIEPDRTWYDDDLIFPPSLVHFGPNPPGDGLLLVRAEREKPEYHVLAGRSVSTLRSEGDKSYGAKLGWWTLITSPADLPEKSTGHTVLKPLVGSRTHGLIMAPSTNATKQRGMSTRARLIRGLESKIATSGGMYLQPWHPGLQAAGQNMALRIFYGYDPAKDRWLCLSGMWALRGSAVVHGAGDTIFGPAVMV